MIDDSCWRIRIDSDINRERCIRMTSLEKSNSNNEEDTIHRSNTTEKISPTKLQHERSILPRIRSSSDSDYDEDEPMDVPNEGLVVCLFDFLKIKMYLFFV